MTYSRRSLYARRRESGSGFPWGSLLITIAMVLLIGGSLGRGLLVSSADAIRAVATYGFTNPTVRSSQWLFAGLGGCDGQDAALFVVDVTNPAGQSVQVLACSGWPFKGWTIRVK